MEEPRLFLVKEVYKNDTHEKIFGSAFVITSFIVFMNSLLLAWGYITLSNFLSFFIVLVLPIIFSAVLFYNERYADRDYLKITPKGVEFRSTPIFPHGFFIKKGFIPFTAIKKVRLVQLESKINFEQENLKRRDLDTILKKPFLLYIVYNRGKSVLIGERFPNEALMQALVLMEGGAKLGQTWKKFREKFPSMAGSISDAVQKVSGWFKNK